MNISDKLAAVIISAVDNYIKEEKKESKLIHLNERKEKKNWVNSSRKSMFLKRMMMQMRASL